MQYASHATEQDCVAEVRKLCKATSVTYPINDLTRRFNFALDRYFHLAFTADGRWKFDDRNQTDVPLETLNIVSGTNKYDMSTLTSELHELFRIEILGDNGKPLYAIEQDSFEAIASRGEQFANVYSTASEDQGVPTKYLKWGDFLYLSPCPNYSETGGIKFYFNRKASYMAATDTTKVPGVPAIHHEYLCRVTAQPYLLENLPARAQSNEVEIQKWEYKIGEFFARRDQDAPKTFNAQRQWPKR